MKKVALIMAVVFLTVTTFGQTATKVKKDPAKQTTKTEQSKLAANTNTVSKTVADTTKTKVALKKDGTPDKRFNENKTTVKTTGPLKKNGTPDMRYKTNKDTTRVKTTVKK